MILKTRPAVRRKGTLPEFALIAVVFLMFVIGILEYARFIFTQNVFYNAAREGARYAVVQTTAVSTATVQNYVDAYLAGQGSALVGYNKTTSINVFQANTTTGADNSGGWTNAGQGQAIGVSITGSYSPIVPKLLFMNTTLSINATSIMYSEGGL